MPRSCHAKSPGICRRDAEQLYIRGNASQGPGWAHIAPVSTGMRGALIPRRRTHTTTPPPLTTTHLHTPLQHPTRRQESSEDVSGGLPFLADLALGLSVLACSMLRILYNGPEVTPEEEACHDLLCSKLLQR